ncbi:beta-microseminoprotein-like [Dreissena polymorpha]|uniref:Beta-microseminoprotein n=1 Tax=Dreissena polymorpha TaxID=45954 RepID=A0A9D4LYZ7_DREPO|nr:beta-microseminoprotein-like [Dreissena polymorpha]KAH3867770.1 hypothetical protein DPMN_030906 [Dreissena polymorpha]
MDAKLLLVFIGIVQISSGMMIEKERVHGKVVKFCTHKGIRFLPKSNFIDYDECMTCECSDDGLSCYSMCSDLMAYDESQCTSVKIACQNKWVLTADTTKTCPEDMIPEY